VVREIDAQALVESARRLLGMRYRHTGRTVHGVDCMGVVLVAARHAGLDLLKRTGYPDLKGYGERPGRVLLEAIEQHCERITAPIVGALLLFNPERGISPQHAGLATDSGTVIHCVRGRRRVVETAYRRNWLHSCWRLPGVRYAELGV
jgi:cell wall-associated NlpC family hydrolase